MTSFFMKTSLFLSLAILGLVFLAPSFAAAEWNKPKMATQTPAGTTAPAEVKTRLGTLKTVDGYQPDLKKMKTWKAPKAKMLK
jgi:uncharacterized membrane protein